MISTDAFNYINVLDKAADASWKRENVIINNLSNVDTPGYKRKDLSFEGVLREAMGHCQSESLTEKVDSLQTELKDLNPSVYTDLENYSYRLDTNNVDVDVEEAEFASEQIRYQGLIAAINNEFNSLQTVLN